MGGKTKSALVLALVLLCAAAWMGPALAQKDEKPASGMEGGDRLLMIGLFVRGVSHYGAGEYRVAIGYFGQALEEARGLADREFEALLLANLGNCHWYLGGYQRAVELYEKSLAVFVSIDDHLGEAASLGNLGNCYYTLGDYPRAIENYANAMAIFCEIGDRPGEAKSLEGLGNCYYALGDYRQAIEHYETSLAISRDIGDRPGEAASLNNLGKIYKLLTDYDRAIGYLEESMVINRAIERRLGEAHNLNNLGTCYRDLGDLSRAIASHERALAIFEALGYPFGQANSLNQLGRCHEALANYDYALDLYERALALAEELGAPEMERDAQWGLGRTYRALGQPDKALFHYEQALTVVETVRARVQQDNLGQSFLESVRSLYEEYLELLIELGRYEDTMLVAQRLQALVLLNLLSVRPAAVQEPVSVGAIRSDTERVTAGIPEETAVVEYFVASDAVRIWVTTQEGTGRPVSVPVSRADLINLVISFRRELEKGLAPGRPPASLDLFVMARELYELLIQPVLGALEGREHLVIIPQGPLFYVPFAVLYTCPGCEGAGLYHGGRFLVEQFALSYAPSLTTLKYTRSFSEETVVGEGLLALVDPDGSLPGARGEADAISAKFRDPTVFLAQEATEAAVRRWAAQAQHVLFSTHGVFDARNPMYSYLLMHPAGEDDGRLHTFEVFELALRADLVTLSACETLLPGVRDVEESFAQIWGEEATRVVPSRILDGLTLGDELVGLTRAFIQAGAQSVLTTHWRVCDEATQRLMVAFYGELLERGLNKAQALREAQLYLLNYIDGTRMLTYRHPVYWAAFTLYGDWR